MTTAPRVSDTPLPGFYRLKLIRGGPWVPAQIKHDEGGWQTMLDGKWSNQSTDPWLLPDMERIHFGGRDTTEAEVNFMLARKRHAEVYEPDSPAANPRKAIDLDKIIPF